MIALRGLRATLAAACLLVGVARADLPDPRRMLDSGAVSLGVVRALPDDEAVRDLIKTAWAAVQGRPAVKGSFLSLLTGFLSSSTQEDMLLQLLPLQGVRIDGFDEQGRDRASFMLTAQGWRGLQTMYYNSLLNGPDGQPYPTEQVGAETVTVRVKPGQTREEATVMARVGGTFYSFANLATARRLLGGSPAVSGPLAAAWKRVDTSGDTFGAVINQNGSLGRFLAWINKRDYGRVRDVLGEEELTRALAGVRTMTWQGNMESSDAMLFQLRFQTASADAAEALESALSRARATLAEIGRVNDLQVTSLDTDVLVKVEMIGYRKMLTDYLQRY